MGNEQNLTVESVKILRIRDEPKERMKIVQHAIKIW